MRVGCRDLPLGCGRGVTGWGARRGGGCCRRCRRRRCLDCHTSRATARRHCCRRHCGRRHRCRRVRAGVEDAGWGGGAVAARTEAVRGAVAGLAGMPGPDHVYVAGTALLDLVPARAPSNRPAPHTSRPTWTRSAAVTTRTPSCLSAARRVSPESQPGESARRVSPESQPGESARRVSPESRPGLHRSDGEVSERQPEGRLGHATDRAPWLAPPVSL